MARFSGGFRTGTAGSTTLPAASLYAVANCRPVVYEIGAFNTTATSCAIAVRRATTAGGTHTAREEIPMDDTTRTALATLFDSDTGTTPTLTTGNIRTASLGAAIGSGVIWTFPRGIEIPDGTGNGIVIIPLTGTGQILDIYFEWEE